MAEQRKQLEAFKAASSKYQSQLREAASKDEAIALAISSAENLMKALKICSDPSEKGELRAQVNVIIDAADRIKKTEQWKPLSHQRSAHAHATSKDDEINLWAAAVAESTKPGIPNGKLGSDVPHNSAPTSSVSLVDPSDNSAPSPLAPMLKTPGTSAISDIPFPPMDAECTVSHGPNVAKEVRKDVFGALIDLHQHQPPRQPASVAQAYPNAITNTSSSSQTIVANVSPVESHSVTPKVLSSLKSTSVGDLHQAHRTVNGNPTVAASTARSRTQVRRLKEPISTRKLARKEEILLLRSSVVNGFKFWPWDKNPATSEFVLEPGADFFTDSPDLDLSPYQHQFFAGWVRARGALPPPSMYPVDRDGLGPVMGTTRAIDLVQDAATDCSVVASLCAGIARSERGHDMMLSNTVWPFDQNRGRPVISSNGKYMVRLNFNGCWRKVVIDDRLPVSKSHRLLHVIDRHNPALLWPALLEKAYLKVRGGYDFPGSNSCSDLWTLTGWIPEQIYLQETDTVPSQLWTRLYKAFLYGDVLVTLGTGKMSNRQERELGLEGQHSYVVLDMRETDHDRLLLVKNPWVEGKGWRGPRPPAAPVADISSLSEYSATGTDALHKDSIPSKERPHPTTFWIGLDHVIQYFESLYVNWNPGLFRYRQDIHFEWVIENQKSPAGCIITHPQFSFSSKEGGVVWFLLCRHFRDTPGEMHESSDAFNDGTLQPHSHMSSAGSPPKGYMSVSVCDGHGERIYIKDACLESSPYVNVSQSLLRWDCDADSTYTVVIDQDELPASTYIFSLSAFSNGTINLEPATSKYAHTKIHSDQWRPQTAGGSTSSPRYFENPQYTLEVKERCALAILLTSVDHQHPLHVKLVYGYGKRMYRLQSRDVLIDSGDHRGGSAFAEIQGLQPGIYTIICSLFEAGKTGDYALRVDSTSEIVLEQIPRDCAGLILMKLKPVCFGPDVHKMAAPVIPSRLASYIVIARFVRAKSPRSHDLGMLGRSPLRLSIELGRGPERKFLIASEGGEYADSATVRSESVTLEPALASQGGLWLVLDRLCGPGSPVEEWYEVEIFTDIPKPCTVGVWRGWDD
ncbi:calpain-like protease palB/rim-13 [Lindgomyces ingoldianus]|uniref:Calpain-like protease palB/rim-13 n=1 Tax=Lindgomyces ingoldianus TaxID=673940 RepID=A0ACB6QID8_9PLEO|nr:calpain-like protease palB/rim-13 [Lindgomyces ingoldianus]KAF2466646.1 calpain-like protease palB/rim-13 [Lindgomyces ingoldianus]